MNFLKIDQVEGESLIRRHEKEIEVLSWNWTISNVPAASSAFGAGAAVSKPVVSGITFTHYVDSASPKLLKLCLGGSHVRNAILSVSRDAMRDKNASLDYFKISLDNVIITSVILSDHDANSPVVETVTMEFTRVTEEYTNQSPTGAAGTILSTSYDIERAQLS